MFRRFASARGASGVAVGDEIGHFEVERRLGEGAMGEVLQVRRRPAGDVVALKLVKQEFAGDERYRRRFVREAHAARTVAHPNLVDVLESGEIGGRQYLAMRFVDGQSLEELLTTERPLSVERVVGYAMQIASALDALHAVGLIHRDIKSSNIMIDPEDNAVLTDFGLAKGTSDVGLTAPGQVLGTLDYLAPERIRGEDATPASDLYALGCVVFECLTGEPPFGGRGILQVGLAHLEEMPADPCLLRPDAPPALGPAVLEALRKVPDERPPTACAYAGLLADASRR